VPDERGHQGRGDRLGTDGLAFLAQPDQALLRVEVIGAQGQGAAGPAGGLGVQAQQQRVQLGVIPGGRRRAVDLGEARAGDGAAGRGQAAGLGDLPGRVVRRADQAVVLGLLVHAAQGADEVLGGAAPAAGVPARDGVLPDVLDQLADLRRRRLIDPALTPVLGDAVPVGAVGPPAALSDQGGHDRDVLRERRRRRAGGRADSRSAGVRPIRSSTSIAAAATAGLVRLPGRQVR
jgi:hypothetical protein